MTKEEQKIELLVYGIKDNCYEVAKNLLKEHDKQIRADAERDFQNSDYWNDYLAKVIADAKADAIEECFLKIEERFNDDTTVSFDLPIEEILGEDVDVDDFCMLAEEIVQQYKSLIFQKLREAKKQLKEQKN